MGSNVVFYSGGRGAGFMLGTVLVGIAVLVAAGTWGLVRVAEWIVPTLGRLGVVGAGIFVAGVLPFSLVREWRPRLAGLSSLMAGLYGLGVWLASFLALWKWLAWLSLPALLIAPLTAPLAVLRLGYLLQWDQAVGIAVGALTAQGIRFYAAWLTRNSGGPEIIDTVAV